MGRTWIECSSSYQAVLIASGFHYDSAFFFAGASLAMLFVVKKFSVFDPAGLISTGNLITFDSKALGTAGYMRLLFSFNSWYMNVVRGITFHFRTTNANQNVIARRQSSFVIYLACARYDCLVFRYNITDRTELH